MHHLFLFESILAESSSTQFFLKTDNFKKNVWTESHRKVHQNGQMMMYKLKKKNKKKKLHSKGQKLASQNNLIENSSNLIALWPLPSPCLHTLTDGRPLSVAQKVLVMLTPFLLFIRFWQLFNKRCVRKGVLVGWTTTWYLVNCTHEKQSASQKCSVKHFSLPLLWPLQSHVCQENYPSALYTWHYWPTFSQLRFLCSKVSMTPSFCLTDFGTAALSHLSEGALIIIRKYIFLCTCTWWKTVFYYIFYFIHLVLFKTLKNILYRLRSQKKISKMKQ